MKLPNIPPAFMLNVLINSNNMFNTSFGSLEDMMNKTAWDTACNDLYYVIKNWLQKQEEIESQAN